MLLACVAGFYVRGLTADPVRLGLAAGSPWWHAAAVSFGRQVLLVRIWLGAGALLGAFAGVAGWRWRALREPVWLALPFAAAVGEPWAWRVREGAWATPTWFWITEAALGLAGLAWSLAPLLRTRRMDAGRP